MVKYPDSKLKCFMRTGKNGAVYRTCATPEKKKQPKKQVRGDPKPASERKLPYLTTTGKKLPKSDRVIKEDKPKKPPLPPKSDKVKKRQQEFKKKKEEPKKIIITQKRSDRVIKFLIREMNIKNIPDTQQRSDMKESIKLFYLNGAKTQSYKQQQRGIETEAPFYTKYRKDMPLDDKLVSKFKNAYLRGVAIMEGRNVKLQQYRQSDVKLLLEGKELPYSEKGHHSLLLKSSSDLKNLVIFFRPKWYKKREAT